MRNLKRALSLTLASVMLLGMMVIGTSAASFNDADDISNVTAATVLQELEVMQGSNGNFMPKQTVTRGQMAIIICKILYGDKLNVDQFADTSIYTDVPANQYYTGYVNLATQLGIISGYGNGKFGPGDPVSTAQASLMLCRALGYFQGNELSGQGWGENALIAITQATKLKLFNNLRLGTNDPLSRDNVSEMVFNTITKTVPVMYNKNFDIYYNDSTSWAQGVTFHYDETLGYKNFGLVYRTGVQHDDNQRPVTVWGIGTLNTGWEDNDGNIKNGSTWATMAGRDEIIYVPDTAVASYTASTNSSTIQRDLRTYNLYVDGTDTDSFDTGRTTLTIDGAPASFGGWNDWSGGSNDLFEVLSKLTGNGKQVYIYSNASGDIDEVVVINTYLAEVTGERTDSDGRYITLNVFGASGIEDRKFHTGNFADGDYVQVTVARNSVGDDYIATVKAAEKVEGKIDAIHTSDRYLRLDGKQIKYSANMTNDLNDGLAVDFTGTVLYLDEYGFILGHTRTGNAVEDYLYLTDTAVGDVGSNRAQAVFTDGTSKIIQIKKSGPSAKGLYRYDIGENGIYELTAAGETKPTAYISNGNTRIKESSATGAATLYATNSNTRFITVNTVDSIFTMYQGYSNVPNINVTSDPGNNGIYVVDHNGDGIMDVVYAVNGGVSNSNKTIFYVAKNNKFEEFKKEGTTRYYRGTAIYVDGKLDENFVVSSTVYSSNFSTGSTEGFYIVDGTNTDGYVIRLGQFDTDYDQSGDTANILKSTITMGAVSTVGTTLKLADGSSYAWNGQDTVFVYIDKDGNVSQEKVGIINTYSEADTNSVKVIKTEDDKGVLATLVAVVEAAPSYTYTAANKSVSSSGTASTTQITAADAGLPDVANASLEGSAEINISGTTKGGIDATAGGAANLGTTTLAGVTGNYTAAYIVVPTGSYGIRQTNELLKSSTWSGDASINQTTGVKTKNYTFTNADQNLYFALGSTPVTFEFDWEYDGTPANFQADYTITVNPGGLTITNP